MLLLNRNHSDCGCNLKAENHWRSREVVWSYKSKGAKERRALNENYPGEQGFDSRERKQVRSQVEEWKRWRTREDGESAGKAAASRAELAIIPEGTIIKEKARLAALRLGIDNLRASKGPLDSIKKHNNIIYRRSCRESSSVDNSAVQE